MLITVSRRRTEPQSSVEHQIPRTVPPRQPVDEPRRTHRRLLTDAWLVVDGRQPATVFQRLPSPSPPRTPSGPRTSRWLVVYIIAIAIVVKDRKCYGVGALVEFVIELRDVSMERRVENDGAWLDGGGSDFWPSRRPAARCQPVVVEAGHVEIGVDFYLNVATRK